MNVNYKSVKHIQQILYQIKLQIYRLTYNIILIVHSKITMTRNVVPYYTVTALVPTLK